MARRSAVAILEAQLTAERARFDRLTDRLITTLDSLIQPKEPPIPASPPDPPMDGAIVAAISNLELDPQTDAYREVVAWARDASGQMEVGDVVAKIRRGWAHELEDLEV